MRNLSDCFEGLLDADFDITDDVISIDGLCKNIRFDIYAPARSTAMRVFEKSIKLDLNIPNANVHYPVWCDYPAIIKICNWICTKPKAWVDKKEYGEFYTAFLRECLTQYGSKRKWIFDIIDTNVQGKHPGKKIILKMAMGSKWEHIIRLAIYDK